MHIKPFGASLLQSILVLSLICLFLDRAHAIAYWNSNTTTINVCTSEFYPLAFCKNKLPRNYYGYEIDLARKVFSKLGWIEEVDITWHCLDWGTVISELKNPDGRCDMAVMGMAVDTASLRAGISFSWPTGRDGVGIMTSVYHENNGIFSFVNAFSRPVWFATLVTPVIIGFAVWLLDYLMMNARKHASADLSAEPPPLQRLPSNRYGVKVSTTLDRYMWESLGRPMAVREFIAVTVPGNIVILGFSFFILVMVTLFTASTTANITAVRLQQIITGIQDLPGKKVLTAENYVPLLQRMGIAAVGFPWNTEEDEKALIQNIVDGTFQALVLDSNFLQHIAAPSCNLTVVGDTFAYYDQAVAFRVNFSNPELIAAYDNALVYLKETGDWKVLENQYFAPIQPDCKKIAVAPGGDMKITWPQVAGLWILLGVFLLIGFGLVALYYAHLKWTERRLNAMVEKVKVVTAETVEKSAKKCKALTHCCVRQRKHSGANGAETMESNKSIKENGCEDCECSDAAP